MKKVGILNSGGDCPGLNAVIASAVRTGLVHGYEYVGILKGWEGLLSPTMTRPLGDKDVAGISYLGGTILGTVNKGRFGAKKGAGNPLAIDPDILQEAKDNFSALGLDALVVIGGDGTLSGAMQLSDFGVPLVGVPKTIDNDLNATDRTFGFSTASQVVVDALDRIHTTASSHGRVIFVETMGRHTGWIALRAGLAGGAHAILLPEFQFDLDKLAAFLYDRQVQGKATVVIVAEGALINNEVVTDELTAGHEVHLGGISQKLMYLLEKLHPGKFEMRNTILGHVQRGGTPNAADRALSKAYGCAAAKAVAEGKFGQMVVYKNQQMSTAPILEAVGELKQVSSSTMEYITARDLRVFIH